MKIYSTADAAPSSSLDLHYLVLLIFLACSGRTSSAFPSSSAFQVQAPTSKVRLQMISVPSIVSVARGGRMSVRAANYYHSITRRGICTSIGSPAAAFGKAIDNRIKSKRALGVKCYAKNEQCDDDNGKHEVPPRIDGPSANDAASSPKEEEEIPADISAITDGLLRSAVERAISTIAACSASAKSDDGSASSGAITTPTAATTTTTTLLVNTLVQNAVGRAVRTVSTNSRGASFGEEGVDTSHEKENEENRNPSDCSFVEDEQDLQGASSATLNGNSLSSPCEDDGEDKAPPPFGIDRPSTDRRRYLAHPAVTGTALAHSIWSETIRPMEDTVIDATCGNGKDSLAVARLLFPSSTAQQQQTSGSGNLASSQREELDGLIRPELICIDVQERAVSNTKAVLLEELGTGRVHESVTVLQSSHAPLPRPRDCRSVGLVCYNLGYLPGCDRKDTRTTLTATLSSLADAALLVRVGGLISVMAYPGTNMDEALSVRAFVDGLAMLTTKQEGGWEWNLDNDSSLVEDVRSHVKREIKRVVGEGSEEQTWRSFEHRPLGRPLSPFLVTAIRIK